MTWRYEHCVCTNVVDGDTADVAVSIAPWGVVLNVRLRLARINAPEVGKPGADLATYFLRQHALNKPVVIECHGKDDYGRTLAEVWADVTKPSINQLMLDGHLVVPWPAVKAP